MKNLRKLGILAAVFAALLLTLIFVLVVQAVKQHRIDNETDQARFELCAANEIQTLTIQADGKDTVFRFRADGGIESISYEGTDYSESQLEKEEVSRIISRICGFSVSAAFDANAQDMANYGLSPSEMKVSVQKKDGSQAVLLIGGLNSSGSGVYVCREGETHVMVGEYALYQSLTIHFEDILNKQLLNLARSEVYEISFSRKSTGDSWIVNPQEDYDNGVYLEPRYNVVYPMKRDAKNELIQLCNSILQLRVAQFVPIPEEDMSYYGLSDPEYQITIRLHSGEEITLSLSMEIGGYYYGYCSNNPYTFCVSPTNLSGLNKSAFEMIDAYVIHGYLDDVRSVTIEINGSTFVMDIMMSVDSDFVSDDTKFTLDQRSAKVYSSNGDCYGLLIFESIFHMPVSRVDYDASPALANVEASIQVVKTDSESVSLKLVPNGEQEYYCFINDIYSGFIVDRSVLYKDNGHELSGFGVWDAIQLTNEAIDNKNVNSVYDRP